MRSAGGGEAGAQDGCGHAHGVHRNSDGARRHRIVAGGAHLQAPAGTAEDEVEDESQGDPEEEQRADAQRRMQRGHGTPESEIDERQLRRHGGDEFLAEEEGEAAAEQDHGNAGSDVADLGKAREAGMQGAQQCADRRRRRQTEPRRARAIRHRERRHGAHQQDAFHAKIDLPALFRQALAKADEEVRNASADRAGGHAEQNSPCAHGGFSLHAASVPTSGRKAFRSTG